MDISVETTVHATLGAVWAAYNDPRDIVHWNAASDDWHTTKSTVELRPGGKFCSRMEAKDGSFGFDFEGTYTNVVPNRLIEYTFGDRKARITFSNTPAGVSVRVSFDSERTHPVEQQRDGWQAILHRFKQYVEAKV
ncbi:MAG: SRPBCC family protein [Proteobacteria bacterium]|nr:SRPBCC family protein [Pseudomonadota bacterium]HQR03558.1 SRPBCC family protein [Rhodocyclaceae bacterium]